MLRRCLSNGVSGLLLPHLLLLIPIGSLTADLSQLESLAHERTVLAQSFAGEKLWYWQKRLNLKECQGLKRH